MYIIYVYIDVCMQNMMYMIYIYMVCVRYLYIYVYYIYIDIYDISYMTYGILYMS